MNTPPAPPLAGAQRWSFAAPTPLGRVTSTYEIKDGTLSFESDDALAGNQTLRWDTIREGATAAMPGLGGRGAPDFPDWVPAQIEWLVLSRTAGGGDPFMRMLPQGDDRDAIVAALQTRLGTRWIGARLPLKEVQARLDIASGQWSQLKAIGLVVAVLASLVLVIMLLGILLHPLVSAPLGIVIGGWLIRKAVVSLRQAAAAATAPIVKADRAAPGPVALQGRAIATNVTPAPITGRPCAWWDVSVHVYSNRGDSANSGEWQQLAARAGGTVDLVELDDGTGRIPIWLRDAQLFLEARTWESGRDTLPAPGVAFLDALGFPWSSGRHLRITESGLEANAPLYVLGTLDERRHVTLPPAPTGLDRVAQSIRTGDWRASLVRALPMPIRMVAAVLIGYLDMMVRLGYGKARVRRATDSPLPELAPMTRLVWCGRDDRPLLVSDGPGAEALAAWRRRSYLVGVLGLAAVGYALYSLTELLTGW